MIRKHKLKYSILSAAAGLSLLGGVVSAAASDGNMLVNGDFSQNVPAWLLHPAPGVGHDIVGGKLIVMNDSDPEAPLPGIVYQCVTVESNTLYHFSAEVEVKPGQERQPLVSLATYWYAGDDCGGPMLEMEPSGTASGSMAIWYSVEAPGSAKSARAALVTFHEPLFVLHDPGPLVVEWDNVYFGQPGEGAIGSDTRDEEERPVRPRPGDEPQREPGDRPQDEPGDEPQREPGDEPQREPGDQPLDEPQDEPQLLKQPEDGKAPLPPSTGTGLAGESPELLLAMGLIGAAMAAALGGTLLMPARRKH
jgi:hypothetical protein